MPYLVTVETVAHVDIKYILGIGDESCEVYSLLYNFYKTCGNTFEEATTYYTITVYEITEPQITYIKSMYDKYEEQIEKITEEYDNLGLEDNLFGNFRFIPFCNSEDEVIFTKAEVKRINSIIKGATKIL
ncbi:MAG: hypothetical protein Barrevirus1_16 [Barrevirus sp.]|uniref:Uncharacterized protein n=1 Tax=Barrevirus sp. TaxID=2487763 RepID=A0A3G4ZR31_9VIRU|nr:MAG: hypothetical protein Barrevirus1_16 [Barrevirus sp.]